MKKETFRGRNIVMYGNYPAVFWPDHPCAHKNGLIRIHRAIAYEKYGNAILNLSIHHKDENVFNWAEDNIELVSNSEHIYKHRNRLKTRVCSICNKKFTRGAIKIDKNYYCSSVCSQKSQERISWPPTATLRNKVALVGYCALGRELSVSNNAVKKRIRNHA